MATDLTDRQRQGVSDALYHAATIAGWHAGRIEAGAPIDDDTRAEIGEATELLTGLRLPEPAA